MSDPLARLNAALDGRYRLEREIGQGGMATVYLAADLRHEREVALKVLKPELAAVVGAERFLAEIKTTANLQHPHVLPLFDSGEADGFLYYVMPYVEGESLREKLDREHQLPVDDAVQIATNLAEALDYAHRRGVIHRDIKPANVLLQAGKPVISDFGIALAVGAAGGGRLTETGLSLGTPHYMSPEQATGDEHLGPATDIYALGCILYEMLTGEPPFTGNTAQAVLGRILAGRLTPAREQRPAIPPNVDGAILRALEKLPADRFAGAEDFRRALADGSFRHGGEPAAVSATDGGPWRAVAIGATTVAVALALALASAWLLSRPAPALPISTWNIALPDGIALYSGSGVNLAVSPDGSNVVFAAISSDGGIQLWLRALDQLAPVPVRGTEGAQNPRFSPDGESIAFIGDDALVIASLGGGPTRTIVSDSVQNIGGLAWGSNGMVYFRKLGLGIWRVPASGGSEEEVTSIAPGEPGQQWVEALPSGRGILHTVDLGARDRDSIVVVSLETGERRALLQGAMARYAHSGHIVYTSADGSLLAAPFDPARLEVTGPSRPLLGGVGVSDSSASTFALSETGVLAYRPGMGVVLGTSGGGGIPVWVSRDGSVEPLDAGITGLSQAPAISPDGRKVALEHQPEGGVRDIWIYDLDRTTLTRATFDGRSRRPFWRPDGEEIGFLSQVEGSSLRVVASDGSETTPRLLRARADVGGDGGVYEGVWTPPDGRWLLFREGSPLSVVEARFTGDANLYYAPPHPDSAATVVLETPFQWYAPAFSPDGRWLAYTSHESGRAEVYVRPFPGPGGRELVSGGGGSFPEWSQDGREIVFQALDGPLVVAAVRTEPDFAVLSRERHPEWPQPFSGNPTQHFDTSPDGRILVIDASDVGTRVRDVVVLNFFEELRRRVRE